MIYFFSLQWIVMVRLQTVLASDPHRDLLLQVWAGETPLFMPKACTLTSQVLIYAPPILLATLHNLWEKLNPAGEGQVNI